VIALTAGRAGVFQGTAADFSLHGKISASVRSRENEVLKKPSRFARERHRFPETPQHIRRHKAITTESHYEKDSRSRNASFLTRDSLSNDIGRGGHVSPGQSATFPSRTGCSLQNFVLSEKRRSGDFPKDGKTASGCTGGTWSSRPNVIQMERK
jgi:hypothetical protein